MENNNTNYFNIIDYIKSKLELETSKEEQIIVSLNEDCNNEPYVEITYTDEDGNTAGLTHNLDELDSMTSFIEAHDGVFEIPGNEDIITIMYDTGTGKLNMVKQKNGNLVGNKFFKDYDCAIFLGYVIIKKGLTKLEKIKMLYEVITNIMVSVYSGDKEHLFNFFSKGVELNNIFVQKNWSEGYMGTEEEEKNILNCENLSILEEVFGVSLIEKNKQKSI